ncbi:MAG: AAA family ATPase [Magnetococcales bacterium]|nr:AAA family ATPase [Magnetococcales bacterium]
MDSGRSGRHCSTIFHPLPECRNTCRGSIMDQLPLTRRQIEILKLIQAGCSNKEVARRLDISDGTVKQHLVEIFRRLKVNNRTKAAQMVTRAEEESYFLPPLKKEELTRSNKAVIKENLTSASLQPMHCMRLRLRSSRELLHRLGGERFNRLNRLIREVCERAARRFEGVVQGSIEGPLVLFGVRFQREDDPVRAVCCAGLVMESLEQEWTELIPADVSPVEIAIYSVPVIVCTDGQTTSIQGELTTPAREEEGNRVVIGQGIVLSADTAKALGRQFARHGRIAPLFPGCQALADHPFGEEERMPEPPFVGRDTELDELHRRLNKAVSGRSESTLVVGEAGFGETRLVSQLRQETANRKEVSWLQGSCHTVLRTVPLHPFLPVLETLAGVDPSQTPARRWEALDQWVNRLPAPLGRSGQRVLALIREREPLPRMQQGDGLYQELLDFLVGVLLPLSGGVVLYLDNLQWMDPCSRLLLSGLASRLSNTHVWLVGVGRKAELRALANHPEIQVLSLLRLPNREILRLLKQMPVAKRLDALQIDLLLEWSRGVPLFAVEIAHHLAGMKKSAMQETIRAHDLFPDALAPMVMERLHALAGVDWRVIRALASSDPEVSMEQYLAWNLHGDPQASESAVTQLYQAGVIKIVERGTRRLLSFGNEMVRAAIRKTLAEGDLVF